MTAPRLTPVGEAVLLSSAALTIMAGAAIAPALPGVAEHFGVDGERDVRVKLLLTLPALVIVFVAPLVGYLVDRLGRRPVLAGGFVLFGLTGIPGLFVEDLNLLLATRLVMGLAVAALVTATSTLVSDYFTGEARSRMIGRQSVYMSAGSILFLLAGGALANLGWRIPFSIYLIGFPFLVLALATIPEPSRDQTHPAPLPVDSSLAVPDLPGPVSLFQPATCLILLAALVGMVVFYQIPVQLPFFLRQEFQATPGQSGMAIAVSTVFSATMATFFSRGLRRLGHGLVMALAFCAMGSALGGLSLSTHPAGVALSLAALGCGLGWLMPNLNLWMAHVVDPAMRGRAMGLLSSCIFLGQFLAPLAASPLLSQGGGFRFLFAVVGMASTLMGLAFLGAGITEAFRKHTARSH